MRQLRQVEDEMKSIHNSVSQDQISLNTTGKGTLGKLQKSRLTKRLVLLNDIKSYLLSNPSEDFVKSELKRITGRVKIIEDSYNHWQEYNCPPGLDLKQKQTLYEKENNLKSLRAQIKVLEFLLS